jgi:hypothetical protein
MSDMWTGNYYTTSFCNKAHRLADGKPIRHECYVLNPKALALEWAGKIDQIGDGISMHSGKIHRA